MADVIAWLVARAAALDAWVQRHVDGVMARLAWWGLPKYLVCYALGVAGVGCLLMIALADRGPFTMVVYGLLAALWAWWLERCRRADERHAGHDVASVAELHRQRRVADSALWKVLDAGQLLGYVLRGLLDGGIAVESGWRAALLAILLVELYAMASPPRPPRRQRREVPAAAQPARVPA